MKQYIKLFENKQIKGDVRIEYENLTEIPIEYSNSIIGGDFVCYSNRLTSLKNSPLKVEGAFWCSDNKLLTSLQYGPELVLGNYFSDSCRLKSLIGAPEKIGGNFWCHKNKLTTLKGCPKEIGGNFMCDKNPDLTPWEMRYILFTNLNEDFLSDHKEVNNLINEFLSFTLPVREERLLEYMERLKEIE